MKQRVDSLGFWRIICTYMIVALHYGYSTGWKLAVEFFFIVSGVLMAYEYDIYRTPYKEYIKKEFSDCGHIIYLALSYLLLFLHQGKEVILLNCL